MASSAHTTDTIGQFFEALDGQEYNQAFRGATLTCKYTFENAGAWCVSLGEDGRLKVTAGDGPANSVVTSSEEVFLEVLAGSRSAFTSLLRNELQIVGDPSTAQIFSRFVLTGSPQAAAQASRKRKKEHGGE